MVDPECYTNMMAGYLLALQRISDTGYQFTARCIEMHNGIDESIIELISHWGESYKFIGKNKVNYQEACEFLKRFIYSGLSNLTASQIKLLDWDIQEYFGLIAIDLNLENNEDSFVSNGGYTLNIENKNGSETQAMLVEIGNYGVIIVVSNKNT